MTLFGLAAFLFATASTAQSENWTQFRGPGGRATAVSSQTLPADIGPENHLLWKSAVAKGHSSPVLFGDRIYLTGFAGKKLTTFALDRKTGKTLWSQVAPYKKIESMHRVGSPATSSVTTDGERVYSFFGSSGLFCYDVDGKAVWSLRMGPFDNQFGATSSPLLADDRLVMVQDHDNGSFLAAFDKRTGKELWRADRTSFRRNYGTPVLWDVAGETQVVVLGTSQVTAYDIDTGDRIWTVRGTTRVSSNTPVIGGDGMLYVATTGGSSAPGQPTFQQLIATADANTNKLLEPKELPRSPIKSFFGQFDRDKDGSLNETEYETIREVFALSRSVALRIRPGGRGDITKTHVDWEYTKSVPRNSSPVYANGLLFMVKDGGVLTSLDAKTGKVTKQGRLAGTGTYYSSPVVGDGKIYFLNQKGQLTVITAEADWKQLATAEFGEDCLATPAIVDGRIYIRTVANLYCFGAAK
jgi:outer membrane protein assembly factor BamB